jgi:hypothetical protein
MSGRESQRLSLEEFQNMAPGTLVEPLVLGSAALEVAQSLWQDRRNIPGNLPPDADDGMVFAQPFEAEDEVLIDRRAWRFQSMGAFPVAKSVATEFSEAAAHMGESGIYSTAQRGVRSVARLLLAVSMRRNIYATTPVIIEIVKATNLRLARKGVGLALPYTHFSEVDPI